MRGTYIEFISLQRNIVYSFSNYFPWDEVGKFWLSINLALLFVLCEYPGISFYQYIQNKITEGVTWTITQKDSWEVKN